MGRKGVIGREGDGEGVRCGGRGMGRKREGEGRMTE